MLCQYTTFDRLIAKDSARCHTHASETNRVAAMKVRDNNTIPDLNALIAHTISVASYDE